MTRRQSNFVRHASEEQLLLLVVFQGNQLRHDVHDELNQRADVQWAGGQSRVTTGRGTTESTA